MGRPFEPAEPLDLDTRLILNWAAAKKTGKVNVLEFYAEQRALDLVMSRNSLYKAMRGEPVSKAVEQEILDTIAVRGWAVQYQQEVDDNYRALSLTMFKSHMNKCRVCNAVCECCGEPDSEERRQAIIKRRYPDPLEVLRDHPNIRPKRDHVL